MYSSHLAQAAYSKPESPVRSDRGTEYAAFERVTARLRQAEAPSASFRARVEAVHENRRLWALLAADVMDPGNALPPPLRAQIVYLYEFTNSHSRTVLKGDGSLLPLIEVNTAVMRGLRGEQAAT